MERRRYGDRKKKRSWERKGKLKEKVRLFKGGAVFNQWSEAAAKRQQPGSQGGRDDYYYYCYYYYYYYQMSEEEMWEPNGESMERERCGGGLLLLLW